ncbi:TPA: hypothetical protein I7730_00080 [Vibrio vulnificus]|uniref:Uncharacterized protein n=1 Tax=Vibrio vulnificus TaxID=672 RepID=A0A8H9K535_VIBVL|nr:hypothetical protein [Vibrio vulnificus]HAS8538195.1 hypothetical protein [Vibrio vulnificus]
MSYTGPKNTDLKFSQKEVQESRLEALEKIRTYLRASDIEGQFANRNGGYHSSEKFLLTWKGNHNLMASEFKLEKTDAAYKAMSGFVCIYGVANIFHESQLGGYGTFERGLLEVGLKLCANRAAQKEFFDEFVKPYNERLEKQKESSNEV